MLGGTAVEDLGRPRQAALGQAFVGRDRQRPVGAGRIADQPGLVREQPPDRDPRDRLRAAAGLELGQPVHGRVVQVQLPGVPQLHDRGAGERLGHGRDPVQRVRLRRAPRGDVSEPGPASPGQLAAVHDARGGPVQAVVLHERGEPGLELGGAACHWSAHGAALLAPGLAVRRRAVMLRGASPGSYGFARRCPRQLRPGLADVIRGPEQVINSAR